MSESYDLYNQIWSVHDLPAGVEYDDSVFVKSFEQQWGREPDVIIKEPHNMVTRVYVGPVREADTGPMLNMLKAVEATRKGMDDDTETT